MVYADLLDSLFGLASPGMGMAQSFIYVSTWYGSI